MIGVTFDIFLYHTEFFILNFVVMEEPLMGTKLKFFSYKKELLFTFLQKSVGNITLMKDIISILI